MKLLPRRINWPALLVAMLFVSFVGVQSFAMRNLARLQPAVIATVDLERIFNNLKEREAADAQMQSIAERLQADGASRVRAIERLEEDLEVYQPGSAKHNETLNEIARASHDYRAFIEWGRRKIDARKAGSLRRIHASIKLAIAREAEEQGYDVVFVNDALAEIPPGDEVETIRQISARRMLYSNPQVDITDDIISRMNREYEAANPG